MKTGSTHPWINNLKLRAGIGKTATSGVSASNGEIRWALKKCRNHWWKQQTMMYASVLGNPICHGLNV
ncbi:hypothetical protein NXW20_00130 [Bacteroides faecis]|nr:hypothetical protein [Bacteroides faecis]MCS2194151.1 hypothetical protein [Bacteroides faecis]